MGRRARSGGRPWCSFGAIGGRTSAARERHTSRTPRVQLVMGKRHSARGWTTLLHLVPRGSQVGDRAGYRSARRSRRRVLRLANCETSPRATTLTCFGSATRISAPALRARPRGSVLADPRHTVASPGGCREGSAVGVAVKRAEEHSPQPLLNPSACPMQGPAQIKDLARVVDRVPQKQRHVK